jgi:hypothetical protein
MNCFQKLYRLSAITALSGFVPSLVQFITRGNGGARASNRTSFFL